jgi:thiol-disulfide isomerase/thioredoxin/YHS domain-containing protein
MQKKSRFIGVLAIALLIPAVARSQEAVHWEPTLESAQRLAAETNRLVLIQFGAPWCVYCKRMEAEVLTQPSLAGVVAANYVAVKLNADYFRATATQYGVTDLPTTAITTPQGKLLDTIKGRTDAAVFAARLTQIAATARQSGAPTYAQVPGTAQPPSAVQKPVPPTMNPPVAGAMNPPPTGAPSNLAGPMLGSNDRPAGAATTQPNNGPAQGRYTDYFRRPADSIAPIAQPQSTQPMSTNPQTPVAYPLSAPAAGVTATSAATVQPMGAAAGPSLGQAAMPSPAVQSGTQSPPLLAQQPNALGTGNAVAASPTAEVSAGLPTLNPPLALDGFCPVMLAEKQQWTAGDRRWGAIHRGRTYLFSGPEAQRTFFKDPDRYSPAVSGNDVVLAAEQGQVVSGMREHGVFYGPRIYLFSSEATLEKFSRNPSLYANQTLGSLRNGAYAGQPLQ